MCSVQEADNENPVPKEKSSTGRVCMKCKEKAILITRVNDAFCRECFMIYATHKFRAAIGKSKLIRDGESVLVGISGGQSSSCLLHLIQEGLSGRAHKKLRFRPALLFIDEGAVIGMSAAERLDVSTQVIEIMEATGFPCYVRSLEEAVELDIEPLGADLTKSSVSLDSSVSLPSSVQSNSNTELLLSKFKTYDLKEDKLTKLLSAMKSVSAKEELLRNLRQKLFVEVAKEHKCTKVMVGENSVRLSVRLLSDMAQGKGAHVSIDTAFSDTRHNGITFVRPVRDFSSKEVSLYNVLNNVKSVFIPTITTKAPDNTSIEHLTEKFVTSLQADYPSTTSNIMRTGEKLSTEINCSSDTVCAICQAPLDTDVGPSSALSAVEFSQRVSTPKSVTNISDVSCNSSQCCGKGDGGCHTTDYKLTRDDVLTALCYGCRLIVKDLNNVDKLPDHILREIAYRNRRSKMKSDIENFLLEPDNEN